MVRNPRSMSSTCWLAGFLYYKCYQVYQYNKVIRLQILDYFQYETTGIRVKAAYYSTDVPHNPTLGKVGGTETQTSLGPLQV